MPQILFFLFLRTTFAHMLHSSIKMASKMKKFRVIKLEEIFVA